MWISDAVAAILNNMLSYHSRQSLRLLKSFNVTRFGTDRKPVCDFLLVNE